MTRNSVNFYAISDETLFYPYKFNGVFLQFGWKKVYFRILENYLQFSKIFMTPFYALLITKLSNARLKGRKQSCGRQIHLYVTFTCLALVLIRSVPNGRRHLLGSLCGPTLTSHTDPPWAKDMSYWYWGQKFCNLLPGGVVVFVLLGQSQFYIHAVYSFEYVKSYNLPYLHFLLLYIKSLSVYIIY